MDKKDSLSKQMERSLTDRAKQAILDGKGKRAIGGNQPVAVGNEYRILKVDFINNLFPPTGSDYTSEEIREMTEEEKREAGFVLKEWFTFNTNVGDLSFSAVIGQPDQWTAEFWNDANKAEDFDFTKVFKAGSRTPEAWLLADCDGIVGKALKCVATKDYERFGIKLKARAFVLVD